METRLKKSYKPAEVGQVVELPPEFKEYLGCGRFGRIGVAGDGSCFFHSICALLHEKNYLNEPPSVQATIAHNFRCRFSKTFKKNDMIHGKRGSNDESYEDLRKGFCVPSKWANETMINHASKVLNINLIFLDLTNGLAYCGVHGSESLRGSRTRSVNAVKQPTAVFSWVTRSHFEPIVRIESKDPGEPVVLTTLFEPSKSEEDANTVEILMAAYDRGCSRRMPLN